MEGYIFNKCAKFHAIEIHLRVFDQEACDSQGGR